MTTHTHSRSMIPRRRRVHQVRQIRAVKAEGEEGATIRGFTKFEFTVEEGKGRLNPAGDKNKASTAEGRWRNPV